MTDAILSLVSGEGYVPMSEDDIAELLELDDESREKLDTALRALVSAGVLTKTKHGKIIRAEETGLINGIFHATSRGFGFVTPDAGGEDIFVSRERTLGALNNDRVQVRRIFAPRQQPAKHHKGKGKKFSKSESRLSHEHSPVPANAPEGEVVQILERAATEVIGCFREIRERVPLPAGKRRTKRGAKLPRPKETRRFIVRPDDPKLNFRIRIAPSMRNEAKDGDKVLVELTKYPSPREFRHSDESDAAGKILKVFGEGDSKSANYKAILYENNIRTEFDDDVYAEADSAASEPVVPDGQLDLRDETIFTIDGADAKDLDDAISLKRDGDGYLLGVHIADVSHYVKPGRDFMEEFFNGNRSRYHSSYRRSFSYRRGFDAEWQVSPAFRRNRRRCGDIFR